MFAGWEMEVLQGAFAAAGAGAIGSVGWLTGKLWNLWRHETASMKQNTANTQSMVERQQEVLQRHMERDEEIHRELIHLLGDIRTDIAGHRRTT